MPNKIKLEYQSDILLYRCAHVGDDWEEQYKGNDTVLSLLSKLASAETPEDEGIIEAMEELIMEIGAGEEGYLWTAGELTVDGETPEDAEEEDDECDPIYSIEDGEFDFCWNHDFKDAREIYESQIKDSKVCVVETTQNKRHIASLISLLFPHKHE